MTIRSAIVIGSFPNRSPYRFVPKRSSDYPNVACSPGTLQEPWRTCIRECWFGDQRDITPVHGVSESRATTREDRFGNSLIRANKNAQIIVRAPNGMQTGVRPD